jgi:hypothetical protein
MRKHLTYANVVSTICLFLALGGAAYAGTKLAKGSVGTEQLKAEAVTKGKLHPNSVNSKKVVNGSLTGEDIDAATLGKVPNATNAEYANNAGSATNATHASSAENADHASNADNANHATSADTAANADTATTADRATTADSAETIDGVSPSEFGPVLVASAEAEVTFSGEFFFSVSGVHAGLSSLPGVTTILPGRKFRATDFAVHFEGTAAAGLDVHVSLVVNGTAQEVCTVTEVSSTCTPSTTVEIPAGAQVAWKTDSASPVMARPEFALRLLPG